MAKFNETWLPAIVTGVIFTLAGGVLGWGISYKDTQAQIRGLNTANEQLQGQNSELHEQLGMLKEQNSTLKKQQLMLGGIHNQLAGVGHDVRRVLVSVLLNAQGQVVGGDVLTDSDGKVLTDSNGHPLTSSPRRP